MTLVNSILHGSRLSFKMNPFHSRKLLCQTFVTSSSCKDIKSNNCSQSANEWKSNGSGKILIDGIEIYWEKFGNGPQVALCLPGLSGTVEDNFVPVAAKMDLKKVTLIAWDPPGYGKSRPPDRDVFIEEHVLARDARLAHSLMQELGYKHFSTIGWSNGGTTGALIAAAFPHSVRNVAMCNSPLTYDKRFIKVMEAMADLDNWEPKQLKAMLSIYGREYAIKLLNDWRLYAIQEEKTQKFKQYLIKEIKKVRAPTFFIRYVKDVVCSQKDAQRWSELIPMFTLHKVMKGAHSHLEFLDEFVKETESFLCD